MSDFPYKRFVLTPSFLIKEVEIVGDARTFGWSPCSEKWVSSASGKEYRASEVFQTEQDAAEFANARIAKEAERLQKLQVSLEKRKANVAKWESKA